MLRFRSLSTSRRIAISACIHFAYSPFIAPQSPIESGQRIGLVLLQVVCSEHAEFCSQVLRACLIPHPRGSQACPPWEEAVFDFPPGFGFSPESQAIPSKAFTKNSKLFLSLAHQMSSELAHEMSALRVELG